MSILRSRWRKSEGWNDSAHLNNNRNNNQRLLPMIQRETQEPTETKQPRRRFVVSSSGFCWKFVRIWFLRLVALYLVIGTLFIVQSSLITKATVVVWTSSSSLFLQQLKKVRRKRIRRPCRYDGHCPTGTTCGIRLPKTQKLVRNSTSQEKIVMPGECQAFPIAKTQGKLSSSSLNKCVEACRIELEMDEHFFHEAWPIIQSNRSTLALSRPRGCILNYIRKDEDNKEHWKSLHSNDDKFPRHEPAPSIVTWEQTRFRHIVRIDPIFQGPVFLEDADGRITQQQLPPQMWRAYCTSPCENDQDCQTLLESNDNPNKPWQCIKGACQRNPLYWERNLKQPQMVIVTGATGEFADGLRNLVASARYWAPNHGVVIYNLGGLDGDEIKSWSNVIAFEWPKGIPDKYPSHVHQGKVYAWKPIIIQETLKKYGAIFWLDAGSTLTGPITPAENIVKRNGIFLVKGQDMDMKPRSHVAAYQWFGFDKATMKVGPHFSGNTQAYMRPSRFVSTIVNKNAACALNDSCISPEGSLLSNHRYDQTTLSLCAYHPAVRAPHHTEYLSASQDDLNPDLNYPSYRFVWTARSNCHFYVNQPSNSTYIQKGLIPMDWLIVNQTGR